MGQSQGFGQFATKMFSLSESIDQVDEYIIRKAVLVTGQALVTTTPRDTGRAAGSWVASVVDNDSQPPEVPKPLAQAIADISSGASSYKSSMPGVYVYNNLPYIIPLNRGHSMKAPIGWIQNSIKQGVSAVGAASPYLESGAFRSLF